MLDLPDKDFKTAFINKFNKLKESVFKQQKESMMTKIEQIKNLNKNIEIIKWDQNGIMELKIPITEI